MMGIRNIRIHLWPSAAALTLLASLSLYRDSANWHEYQSVSGSGASCQYLPFRVPADGSVSLEDCWQAEGGPESGMSLEKYRDLVAGRMLPGHEMAFDTDGNVIMLCRIVLDPDTQTVRQYPVDIDPNEWPGGLRRGSWVNLPELNGDGQAGPLEKLDGPDREATMRAQRIFREMHDHVNVEGDRRPALKQGGDL